MKRNRINKLLRGFVKKVLTPTENDIRLVSNIYRSFTDLLGINNCIQIGSFPRYTAIRPLHDLDILFVIGEWYDNYKIPDSLFSDLKREFEYNYKNPTNYRIEISVQSHSISFKFMDGNDEKFAVDIVPALKRGVNEFHLDTYYVPEILLHHTGNKRTKFYNQSIENSRKIEWIKTDPRGYTEVTTRLNKRNTDFRKSVKFAKGWKHHCKEKNDDFKLKSFHIEQLITIDFQNKIGLEIFDSLFIFFTSLKDNIRIAKIKDRADSTKYIDEYINELTEYERKIIHEAIDSILIQFEKITESTNFNNLISSGFYKRVGKNESFLFDQKIPTLIDNNLEFETDGFIEKESGFRHFVAKIKQLSGVVDTKNSIRFKLVKNGTNSDLIKWKVRNSDNSPEPRGEITDNRTLQNPEKTAYLGEHFAECYAIKNKECIARDNVKVIVKK